MQVELKRGSRYCATRAANGATVTGTYCGEIALCARGPERQPTLRIDGTSDLVHIIIGTAKEVEDAEGIQPKRTKRAR